MNLSDAFDILSSARNSLSEADYIRIWGEHLGAHIWRQEGNDLLRIWTSGLTIEQKKSFVRYLQEE